MQDNLNLQGRTSASSQAPNTVPGKPTISVRVRAVGICFLLIIALAAAIRGMFVREYSACPLHNCLIMDERYDDLWGQALAAGKPTDYDHSPYYREPGYAYFLVWVYKLTGHNLAVDSGLTAW